MSPQGLQGTFLRSVPEPHYNSLRISGLPTLPLYSSLSLSLSPPPKLLRPRLLSLISLPQSYHAFTLARSVLVPTRISFPSPRSSTFSYSPFSFFPTPSQPLLRHFLLRHISPSPSNPSLSSPLLSMLTFHFSFSPPHLSLAYALITVSSTCRSFVLSLLTFPYNSPLLPLTSYRLPPRPSLAYNLISLFSTPLIHSLALLHFTLCIRTYSSHSSFLPLIRPLLFALLLPYTSVSPFPLLFYLRLLPPSPLQILILLSSPFQAHISILFSPPSTLSRLQSHYSLFFIPLIQSLARLHFITLSYLLSPITTPPHLSLSLSYTLITDSFLNRLFTLSLTFHYHSPLLPPSALSLSFPISTINIHLPPLPSTLLPP